MRKLRRRKWWTFSMIVWNDNMYDCFCTVLGKVLFQDRELQVEQIFTLANRGCYSYIRYSTCGNTELVSFWKFDNILGKSVKNNSRVKQETNKHLIEHPLSKTLLKSLSTNTRVMHTTMRIRTTLAKKHWATIRSLCGHYLKKFLKIFPGDSLFDEGLVVVTGVVPAGGCCSSTAAGAGAAVYDGMINFTAAGSSNDASSWDASGLPGLPSYRPPPLGCSAGCWRRCSCCCCCCSWSCCCLFSLSEERNLLRSLLIFVFCACSMYLRLSSNRLWFLFVSGPVAGVSVVSCAVWSAASGADVVVVVDEVWSFATVLFVAEGLRTVSGWSSYRFR